jgi:hypothetical protein
MKRMLLTTIHGYYLQALARLPRDQLCSQHLLYSMMHYGHCFGPLDPVSNIIFSTIWYSSACPLPSSIQNSKMDMVSTSAMLRIAVRSFYGLVSFLCTRYDILTVDRAMHDLLEAGADLLIADPNFHGNHAAAGRIPSATVQEAYAAAAAAAHHPQPQAHIGLLRQSSLITRMGSIYLKGSGPLSCDVVCRLSSTARHLSSSYFQGQLLPLPETRVLDKLTYNRVNQKRVSFWNQHARAVTLVKSAMAMYNSQPGVSFFNLLLTFSQSSHLQNNLLCDFFLGVMRNSELIFFVLCRYPNMNFMLSAVSMSTYMALSTSLATIGNIIIPISISSPHAKKANLLMLFQFSSLPSGATMAPKRSVSAALLGCHL